MGCWENTRKACKSLASTRNSFLVFSQHPKWVITPVNPLKVWSIAKKSKDVPLLKKIFFQFIFLIFGFYVILYSCTITRWSERRKYVSSWLTLSFAGKDLSMFPLIILIVKRGNKQNVITNNATLFLILMVNWLIGHSEPPEASVFKARLSAKLMNRLWFFILIEWSKTHYHKQKVCTLPRFGNESFNWNSRKWPWFGLFFRTLTAYIKQREKWRLKAIIRELIPISRRMFETTQETGALWMLRLLQRTKTSIRWPTRTTTIWKFSFIWII